MIEKVVEGKFLIDGKIIHCCVGIERGIIVDVKKSLDGETRIRFPRGLILPSAVDVHVHLRDPGLTHKEDFSTGTLSAAFGGVSCVIDMPNTKPPTVDKESCKEKISIGERKSYVDFGIYLGVNENNLKNLKDFEDLVTGFKIYLPDFDVTLLGELSKLKVKKVLAFHAEERKCIEKFGKKAENLIEHAKTRASVCEKMAVEKVLKEMEKTDLRIHFCHISSSISLYALSRFKKKVSVGVTPHHLLFKASRSLTPQSYYKVNPPLRTSLDQEALWEALLSGEIDIIESDHAPHTIDEKEVDFSEAPSGVPGVETMYPVMLYVFLMKGYPLERLVSALCSRPARLFGLKKGRIAKGMDADFIVVDLKKMKKIRADRLHYKCGWTPFEGMKGIFPTDLFIRGERIIEDEELIGDRGFGKFVKPREGEESCMEK